MKKFLIHEIAALFPAMKPDEFAELTADIKANGLRKPIILYDGKILDGRHRFDACEITGVRKQFAQYKGNQPLAYCVSANLKRRHLSVGERAAIVLAIEGYKHGGDRTENHQAKPDEIRGEQDANLHPTNPENHQAKPDDINEEQDANLHLDSASNNGATVADLEATKPKTKRANAAKIVGVSKRSLASAAAIKKADPELFERVAKNEITLNRAQKILRDRAKAKLAADAAAAAPPIPRDETGWPIPKNLIPLWNRRGEVDAILDQLKSIEKELKAAYEDNDILWAAADYQRAIMEISSLKGNFKEAILYSVCTQCQGKLPDHCQLCRRRGFISQRAWKMGIPEEMKAVRANLIAQEGK